MSSDFDYIFKLHLIGSVNTGKSSILCRLHEGTFLEDYTTTIGHDFKIHTIKLGDKVVKLQIWDTSGQERYKALTSAFYRGSMGLLLIYNVTDRQSFIDIEDWLDLISKFATEKAVKVLIGNKCDLEKQRQVSFEEAKAYADKKGMQFFETSAKSEDYVEEVFFWLAEEIRTLLEGKEESPNGETENNKVVLDTKPKPEPESKQSRCWQ